MLDCSTMITGETLRRAPLCIVSHDLSLRDVRQRHWIQISNKISRVVRNIMYFTSNIQEWFLWIRRGSADSIIKTTLDSTPMNLINCAPSQPNKLKAIYYYTCISNTSILVCLLLYMFVCFQSNCINCVYFIPTPAILWKRSIIQYDAIFFPFILMIWTYFIV